MEAKCFDSNRIKCKSPNVLQYRNAVAWKCHKIIVKIIPVVSSKPVSVYSGTQTSRYLLYVCDSSSYRIGYLQLVFGLTDEGRCSGKHGSFFINITTWMLRSYSHKWFCRFTPFKIFRFHFFKRPTAVFLFDDTT